MTDYRRFLSETAIVIFLFHGVVSTPRPGIRNYTHKHIDIATFRDVCGSLAAAGAPVSLEEALAMLSGRLPMRPGAFAVTFDDGFRNNLTVAAPVLEDLEMPATVYCTTSFIEGNAAGWIDLIEEAVERTSRSELELPWEGGSRAIGTEEDRVKLLDEVRAVVKRTPAIDPYLAAEEIREAAGVGPFEPDAELDQKLSWSEVRELGESGLFTVGGHSHTHRILTHLPQEELEQEIRSSIELLTEALGGRPRHYSYPEGLRHCYSQTVIDCLKRHGIESSPTAIAGVNRAGTDPFHLRRVMVDSSPT